MLRQLEDREVSAVSGGETVVFARSFSALPSMLGSGFGIASEFASLFQDLDQIEARQRNWVDTDEDGVPDSPEIVVTADRAHVNAAQVAYQRAFAEMTAWGAIGAGLLTYYGELGAIGPGGQAGVSVSAFVAGVSDAFKAAVDSYAQALYNLDGMDGRFDGYINPDGHASPDKDHPMF